jgi:hypothetical protein
MEDLLMPSFRGVSCMALVGSLLAACAGDTRETAEPAFRRDGWDVQGVSLSVTPETHLAWCSVANDLFALNLHSVPGVLVIPVRGQSATVTCRTGRGWVGTTTIERPEAGRWPATVEVRLAPDPRVVEAIEPKPGSVSVSALRAR